MSQTAFANLIGVSQPTVARWERGDRAPDADVLQRIARQFGVSVDWILTGSSTPPAAHAPQDNLHTQPQYDLQIVADAIAASGANDALLMLVEDDAMEPTIREGGVVIIDQAQRGLRDGLLALRINERIQIRRVQVLSDGRVRLIRTNPDLAENERSEVVSPDGIEVVGSVVWAGGPL